MVHELILISLIFITGLACGSFASVAIFRIPKGEQIWLGRSYCPKCKNPLKYYDLIPLISWLLTSGKCRYCKKNISSSYLILEIISAFLFVTIYLKFGISVETFIIIPTALLLLIIVNIDLEHKIIPDSLQIVLSVLAIIYAFFSGRDFIDSFAGMVLGFVISFSLRWVFFKWKKRESLGLGDVKFFTIAGLFLGVWMFVPFMLISGILGTMLGFFWQKIKKESEFPFGPALAVALLLCLLIPEMKNLFYLT